MSTQGWQPPLSSAVDSARKYVLCSFYRREARRRDGRTFLAPISNVRKKRKTVTATLCRRNRGTGAGLGGGRPEAGLRSSGQGGAGWPLFPGLFPLRPTGGAWPGHWDSRRPTGHDWPGLFESPVSGATVLADPLNSGELLSQESAAESPRRVWGPARVGGHSAGTSIVPSGHPEGGVAVPGQRVLVLLEPERYGGEVEKLPACF